MLGAAAFSAWVMVSLTHGSAGRERANDPESKKRGGPAKAETTRQINYIRDFIAAHQAQEE